MGISKKTLAEWQRRLLSPKNLLTLGLLLLVGVAYVEHRWPNALVFDQNVQCEATTWQDTLAVALEQWKERNSTNSDVYSDTCLANLERADVKRLFVALQQMLKESICSSGSSRLEKRALDRIFGRAFPHGIVNG